MPATDHYLTPESQRAHSTPEPDNLPTKPEHDPDDSPLPDAPPVQEPDRQHAPMQTSSTF